MPLTPDATMPARTPIPARLAVALAFLAAGARAAVFCADTPAAIAGAMTSAKANGEDDEIRIVAGNYPLDDVLRLGNVETEAFALAFSGRWNADCSAQSAGGASTLNGSGERQILQLSFAGATDVAITDLAFVGGFAAFNASGGVVDIAGGRNVAIERSQFYGNEMQNGEAPLRIEAGGSGSQVTLRSNLVSDNIARGITGAYVQALQGGVDVTGNTITANESSTPCPCSALNYGGSSSYTLANNLVWGNEGGDVFINTTNPLHLHNDIGVFAAGSNAPGAGSSGDLSVDPAFAADGVHLLPQSPLVNAGYDDAPGGIGALDGGRGERRVGAGVDIGALETDVLLRDGFE